MTIDLQTFHALVEANRIEEEIAQGNIDDVPVVKPVVAEGDETFDGFWVIKGGQLRLTDRGEVSKNLAFGALAARHVARRKIEHSLKLRKEFPQHANNIDAAVVALEEEVKHQEAVIRNVFHTFPENTFTKGHPAFEAILGA